MTRILDLSLVFTPPAADAPAEALANIELYDESQATESCSLLPLIDPLLPAERKELEWYLEEYWQWPYAEYAQRGIRAERLLAEIGRRLYQQTLGRAEPLAGDWFARTPSAEAVQRQISIISAIPQVLSLPWELLHDDQGFLALRTRQPVTVVRRLAVGVSTQAEAAFTPPLRILLVTARPTDTVFIDPRGVAHELLAALQPQLDAGVIALEFLRPPTRAALRERLRRPPAVHLLHFDGHGAFGADPHKGESVNDPQGMLAFEHKNGTLDRVAAEELGQLLQDSGIRLAVLTACQSAKGSTDDPFSSVATRLLRSGVDAVIAMSASVLAVSAAKYAEAFYQQIAAGERLAVAHERARQGMYDDTERYVHQRRRDEAAAPVRFKDWWLPHFYERRPVSLMTQEGAEGKRQSTPSPSPRSGLALAPRYGFTGRARELQAIERALLRRRILLIHGFGGIGKTALAVEAADWLARTGLYRTVCFISFEQGGDAASLLSAVGRHLHVELDPFAPDDALARLRPSLLARPMLLIVDNLESLLPNGSAPLTATERHTLWEVLLRLNEAQAGILITSQEADFGDGRLASGGAAVELPLTGLQPADALTLAHRVSHQLGIPLARVPFHQLRDLLAQLDHHPLSIQLVLPALREAGMTIERLSEEFATLLPNLTNAAETGRHRSLAASLAYSLSRLPKAHQRLLTNLTPFADGACESDLLAITEIAESDWLRLRPALEQVALLVPEWIGNFKTPYLRFHPVLIPYLRAQTGEPEPGLRARYIARYHGMANFLYREDNQHPQDVREMARRNLPNLRRALTELLQQEAWEEATDFADSLARFLEIFGLGRERRELLRQLETVAPPALAGTLTAVSFLRETWQGEDELQRGDFAAALTRFTELRTRHEALPTGAPLSRGSYQHCLTLGRLVLGWKRSHRQAEAETLLRQKLDGLTALLAAQLDDRIFQRARGGTHLALGDVLTAQGHYAAAREAYEIGLACMKQVHDLRSQGVALTQLGTLALQQRDFAAARQHYTQALKLDQELQEPLSEAVDWFQLGRVAQAEEQWDEAERCYRASLQIEEWHGNAVGAAATCNQLATTAKRQRRLAEAEGWYERVLQLPNLPTLQAAAGYHNLAALLKDGVGVGIYAHQRLAVARAHAERALALLEPLDAGAPRWITQHLLAELAFWQGETERARAYRQAERASYAAFAGNRWQIDQTFGEQLERFAAACSGEKIARAEIAALLPTLALKGWPIGAALERIYQGERDWQLLTEDLNRKSALLILRILESLEH